MTRFDVARTQQPKSTAAYGSLRFGPLRYQLKRTIGMLPTPDNSECSRQHADAWIDLCALATGLGQHEIATLREPDALTLSLAVWEVNSSFFTSRILGETLGRDALTPTRASQTSSTVSPPQDTETPVTS
ncbi:hypothetical protein [Tateyamaria sp.]|uniref:hypothetical protein n=1 Tax=Tateyamaria sp. TaxID=1929288 RepID=UPI003B21646B